MHLSLKSALATLALAALAPAAAHAQVTFNIFQSGSNVNAQATGKLNLTGLTLLGSGTQQDFVDGSVAVAIVGSNGTPYNVYTGIGFAGPASFGSGGQIFASSASGDRFGIVGGGSSQLVVPSGYTSGSPINGSAVFMAQTLSSLGLTPGTYFYKLPNDTLTVNIGAPVPEASTSASLGLLLALGMGGLVLAARRKRAAVQASPAL